MDFTVTITDPVHLAGITWARELHNTTLPPPAPEGEPQGEPPIETDADYVQWVMSQAAASYAAEKHRSEWHTAYEADAAKRATA